jgi:hypothetical protein
LPRKGTKKKAATGRTRPKISATVSQEALDLLNKVATDLALTNPRTKSPNISQAIERLAIAYKLSSRTYPHDLPYPQALLDYLYQRAEAGDEEAARHAEYLESWGTEMELQAAVSEGVIELPGGSYLV